MPTFGEFLLPIFTNGREFMNLEKHLLSLPAKVLVLDLIVVHVVVHVVVVHVVVVHVVVSIMSSEISMHAFVVFFSSKFCLQFLHALVEVFSVLQFVALAERFDHRSELCNLF